MKTVRNENVEMHIYNKAKHGNNESGDTYFVHADEDYCLISIADGLGSGPVAKQAADVIPTVLEEYHHKPVDVLLERCNELMIKKRGATAAIMKINYKAKVMEFSSIGNIRLYILRNGKNMVYPLPVRGYLSGRPQKIKTEEYAYNPGDLFFLHSDGVVLKSPNLLLRESSGANELYENALHSVEQKDDATFIAGGLL